MENVEANEVANVPLVVASSSFESRKIQKINKETLRIKPTIAALAFSLSFVLLGVVLAGFWVASTFTSFEGPGSFPLLLLGVLFFIAGLGSYQSSNEQLIINRNTGVAYIRSWYFSVPLDSTSLLRHINPQDIVAIQTISHVVKYRSNKNRRRSTYTEYQVNLCTSDGDRHSVFYSLKSKKAEILGKHLAKLFDVPLLPQ